MIDFRPLFVTLAEQGRKPAELYKQGVISRSTLQNLTRNEAANTVTLQSLVSYLNVPIEKIISITPEAAQRPTEAAQAAPDDAETNV